MASIQQYISHLRGCYVADNRELAIWDIFGTSVKNLHVLEGEEELATRFFDKLVLPADFGEDVLKKTALYAREKQLVYGCGLVSGKLSRPSWRKVRSIAAPLVSYDAEITETNGIFELRIDVSSANINVTLLEALAGCDDFEFKGIDLSEIPLSPSHLLQLIDQVSRFNPNISGLGLIDFPKLLSESSLKTHYSRPELQVSPAAMLFLAQRSPRTRGIIHELDLLQSKKDDQLSMPIRSLLGSYEAGPTNKGSKCNPDSTPGILSPAQRKTLQAASSLPLSLVIGPPGTGKSYTIASVAIERFIAGESVLIVAKNDQAIEVLAHKIEQELQVPDVVLRGGDPSQLRKIKESIESWLHGYGLTPQGEYSSSDLKSQLEFTTKQLEKIRSSYSRRSKQLLKWGVRYAALDQGEGSFLFRITDRFRKREIEKTNLQLEYLLKRANTLETQREVLVARLAKSVRHERLSHAVQHRREQLKGFLKSIRSRSSGKQGEMQKTLNFAHLLGVFPIWLSTLEGLHKILPMDTELFDLVLVDEATQCDMASALPALQRARRASIVGDPKQLRHVSFLSGAKEEELAKANDISLNENTFPHFRRHSLLDLTDRKDLPFEAVNLLDEHFRSRPELIEFSNREFYHKALKVMRERSSVSKGTQPLVFEQISNGKREPNGANPIEAQRAIAVLEKWITSEEGFPIESKSSFGVLSPFRAQADLIAKIVEKRFAVSKILQHRILVGTPYSFQGAERDSMILSLAIDGESHPQTLRHAERPDVFNVSITRAKDRQIVLHSVRPESLKPDSLLRKFLTHEVRDKQRAKKESRPTRDPFLDDVTRALRERGYLCYPDQSIAGMQVDLLCENSPTRRALALNLVGYPGVFEEAHGLDSFLIFKRTGLEMLPISYPLWRVNPDAILRPISAQLDQRDTTARQESSPCDAT